MLAVVRCMESPSVTRSHCPSSDLRQILVEGQVRGVLAIDRWYSGDIEIRHARTVSILAA